MHRTRLVMLSALIVSICLSGCGPGQIFGPTQTPTPTATPAATATSTPSPTPRPSATPWPTATVADLFPAYGLPGGTIADLTLQRDLFNYVLMYGIFDSCDAPRVTNTVVVSPLAHGKWSERWTVDECGKKKSYLMKMSAAAGGGTDFEIMPEN